MSNHKKQSKHPVLTWEGEFENVLKSLPEPELGNFIERLNAYRRMRRTIAKQQGKRLV